MKTFREYLEGREVNESFLRSLGQNAALAAGGIGAMMGIGGPAQAQTPTTPNQIPLLANQSIDGYRARHKTKTPTMTAKELEAMMDQLNADQKEREAKMSHHEKLMYQIEKARKARGEKESVPDYKKSGESAIERSMRLASRFANPKPPTEIGARDAARNPDGTINQEVEEIMRQVEDEKAAKAQEERAKFLKSIEYAKRFAK